MRRCSRAPLEAVRALLRAKVPHLDDDRHFHPDMEAANALVRGGAVIEAAGAVGLPGVAGALDGPVEVRRGASPVILGLPHTGTGLPDDIRARLNANGRLLADTDWHIHTLYDGLLPEATTVRATFHRYVIDANRDPSGKASTPARIPPG